MSSVYLPYRDPLIRGVAPELARVPGYRQFATGEEDPAWRDEWHQWAERFAQYREDVRRYVKREPTGQARELEKCRRFGAPYFIATWLNIYEPENIYGRKKGWYPWLPFAFQIDLWDKLDWALEQESPLSDIVVSKPRRLGASWSVVAWALWHWRFDPVFEMTFMSRKGAAVDKGQHQGSLFGKFRRLAGLQDGQQQYGMPNWMLPTGIATGTERRHDRNNTEGEIYNPMTGATISGETTTKQSMRSYRGVAYFDEAAFFPGFAEVWDNAAGSSRVRIATSTESRDHGRDFEEVQEAVSAVAPGNVIELDWWLHPDQTQDWLDKERARYKDKGKFDREMGRDPRGGFGQAIYLEQLHEVEVGSYPPLPEEPCVVGIDPGKDDTCVHVFLQRDPDSPNWRVIEAFGDRGQTPEYYASILTGQLIEGAGGFDYRPRTLYDPIELAALCRELPEWTYYGDPAGTQKPHDDSWYDKLRRWSADHTGGRHIITVTVGWKMDQRTYQGRRMALKRLLPFLDFNDTPGVRRLLRALKDYHFEDLDRPRATEVLIPKHDEDSHWVTALEYIAVNLEEVAAVARVPRGVRRASRMRRRAA